MDPIRVCVNFDGWQTIKPRRARRKWRFEHGFYTQYQSVRGNSGLGNGTDCPNAFEAPYFAKRRQNKALNSSLAP